MEISTELLENQIENANDYDEFKKTALFHSRATFCTEIDRLREEHGFKTFGQIQPEVAMSKTLFYDVLNGKKAPLKRHIIKIGLAMKLSLEEINDLLRLAGHKSLYVKIREDSIILFGITHHKSVSEIDALLAQEGCAFSLTDK